MKKRAVLIHGWEGYPEEGWRPWLKKELERRDFKVIVPAMPDTATPTPEKWVPYLAEIIGTPNEKTFLIGHSLGCITILRYLETLKDDEHIGGAILIAGFGQDLEYDGYKGELSSFFRTSVDWGKVKEHCQKFVAIHSDDDLWVPVKHNKIFKDKLSAKVINQHGMKHYSGDDGITELPIVLNELLEMS